ncbi:MAG: hypothetical protein II845_10665 [Oscillospiraceae bacterium]|nr:hypothetical protein [Oscillospiraceae bacterium]
MKQLQFSDGLEEYSLNDRVTVRFNPTDASFLERLAELFSSLDALQEEVAAAQESTPEEEVFPLAKSLDARMRDLLDSFFGTPVCEALFGSMNLFASAGGLPVWANLLLALTEEVEAAMQGELSAREARIAKYTEKYKK